MQGDESAGLVRAQSTVRLGEPSASQHHPLRNLAGCYRQATTRQRTHSCAGLHAIAELPNCTSCMKNRYTVHPHPQSYKARAQPPTPTCATCWCRVQVDDSLICGGKFHRHFCRTHRGPTKAAERLSQNAAKPSQVWHLGPSISSKCKYTPITTHIMAEDGVNGVKW